MEDKLSKTAEDLVESSKRLILAAKLCGKDQTKKEMVKELHEQFLVIHQRFILLKNALEDGMLKKDQVIEEMKSITEDSILLASKYEKKLFLLSN